MIRWFLINFLTLLIIARFLPGFTIDNWTNAFFAVLVIGLINITIKPILHILALPITFMTLGLFALVINTLMLMLAARITEGFAINGFLTAFIASLLMSLISSGLDRLTPSK